MRFSMAPRTESLTTSLTDDGRIPLAANVFSGSLGSPGTNGPWRIPLPCDYRLRSGRPVF